MRLLELGAVGARNRSNLMPNGPRDQDFRRSLNPRSWAMRRSRVDGACKFTFTYAYLVTRKILDSQIAHISTVHSRAVDTTPFPLSQTNEKFIL